ncbi:MAG: NADH-quinone oxidoreductase subunit NuoE [Proteobacteria bacterium]|jgi:NADH-quinone oxidoreductase subunit E|nr:NADH-quinone oxidoreductase subunit NuoE [Pseudomonadota bacterium]NLN63651.1 NADH-quinone oxidoreductase subunit NuoE [Myxococcales bacterium]
MTTNVDAILAQYDGAQRDSLIPILQQVQAAEGYLSQDAIVRIGEKLNLPTSKIYGVATFYNQFRFQPQGKNHFMVCRGTACHVKGSGKLLEKLSQATGVEPGKTSRDGLFSIEVVACMGACALAPAISISDHFYPKVTPSKIDQLLVEMRSEPEKN